MSRLNGLKRRFSGQGYSDVPWEGLNRFLAGRYAKKRAFSRAGSKMQTLNQSFRSNGCLFEQVKREGQAAIFALRYAENGPVIGYDTVLIQVEPAGEVFGKPVPERERMPSSSEYGRFGWSFSSLETAGKKFEELVKAGKNAG